MNLIYSGFFFFIFDGHWAVFNKGLTYQCWRSQPFTQKGHCYSNRMQYFFGWNGVWRKWLKYSAYVWSSFDHFNNLCLGSGCGTVGRAVACNTRGPGFESSHWQLLLNIYFLLTVCRKDENKKKRGREWPIFLFFLKKKPM